VTPRADYQLEMRLAPDEIIVDSFAGGGGASLGIQWALGRGPHIAINHDKEAIALHTANHPESEHFPEDVWQVDPAVACAGRKVGLMWLSPDCRHHSKAKGGKPVEKKIRGLAWTACRWAKAVRPRVIVLENVEEFQQWGPLMKVDGGWRPDPARKGHTFNRFVARLRRLGYRVEWKELRACDYGTPTIRKRLFLIARCDGRPIVWPAPTHGKGREYAWRTAAECIEWSIPCPSIFERKKPLADNTLRRIARGITRYVIDSPKPFLVQYYSAKRLGDDRVSPIDAPLGTQPTENKFAIVAPVIAGVGGRAAQSPERRVDQPYQTITAKADAAIVSPLLVPTTHEGDARAYSLEEPTRTITGAHRGEQALIAPFLKPRYGERAGQEPRIRSLEQPAPVVVPTSNGGDLVSAFLAKHYGDRGQRPASEMSEPVSTITASDHNSLVTSTLINLHGTSDSHLSARSIEQPMPTITASGLHAAEVRAFLCAYYGNEKDGGSLNDPIRTVTSRDRFGLVTVAGVEYQIADIGMRMLAPRELYRAQGFPDSYRIDIEYNGKPMTKTAQVRMCGNSVCPPLAAAIVSANLLGETFAAAGKERVA
jgi:DNA (cytosine-5)-methyltransferase 1